MDDYQKLIAKYLLLITEIFPWDLADELAQGKKYLLLDVREKNEFDFMHINNSINVARGILEAACCWNYQDTEPLLANGRKQNIIVICKSGNRSILATKTMQDMGFINVKSLKLGIKGWNDNDLKTIDNNNNIVNIDIADKWLNAIIAKEKLKAVK